MFIFVNKVDCKINDLRFKIQRKFIVNLVVSVMIDGLRVKAIC